LDHARANSHLTPRSLGDTTFAITTADREHPVPVRGAVVAFEVPDPAAEVARLQKLGVKFRGGITETQVCRFAIVLDPDDSEIILHKRNERHPVSTENGSC